MPGEDVKLPGLGNVDRKYVIWGGVGAAVLIGVVILRGRASAASAGTVAGTSATDTTGTDPNAADTSGYYTDPGAAAGGYGTSPADYAGGYGGGYGGGYDAAGYPVGSQADIQWQQQQYGGGTSTSTAPTTNSQWVTEALGDVPGDSNTVHEALTRVLAGLTVTTAQRDLFLEAVALNNQPPGGYPQPIKTSDTAAHPGPPSQDQKVKIPVVTGMTIPDAERELVAVGLKAHVSGHAPAGKSYARTQSPRAGTVVNRGSTVTITVAVR